MNAEDLAKRLFEVAKKWPCGMTVWHRACGKRGIIVEYAITGDGSVLLQVTFGATQQLDRCLPLELSAVPVGEGGDGEEWKAGV